MGGVYSASVETRDRYFGSVSIVGESILSPPTWRYYDCPTAYPGRPWVADLYLRVIATFERARALAEYALLFSFTGCRVGDAISLPDSRLVWQNLCLWH